MRSGMSTFANRFLPHGWTDLARQILLFCGAYYAYRIVRGLVSDTTGAETAYRNARELVDIERGLGIFWEPSVHAWATSKSWIIDGASAMYVNSHYTITVTTLAWIYLFRNPSFYWIRNMFMVAMGLALVAYVVYPTAPPRFMPEWGFSDSVNEFTGGASTSEQTNMLVNPFAAVPSMHCAFALMLGVPMSRIVRRRVFKVAWLLYPLLVTFVVVSTANHWTADAFLGACAAGIGAACADLLGRLRPGVWSWVVAPTRRRRAEPAAGTATA